MYQYIPHNPFYAQIISLLATGIRGGNAYHNQLLGLSRLPDLGATTDGEGMADVAAGAPPAIVPSEGKCDDDQGEAESPSPNRWGEIEVRDRGNSLC